MDFLQHFLIGKPLEHNAQTSYMLSGTAIVSRQRLPRRRASRSTPRLAGSELTEYQPGPATDGAPPANAIRPAGLHYDYTVDSGRSAPRSRSTTASPTTSRSPRRVRADQTNYDYDNHMIDGNTRDDGTPCGAGGCLYSRPADRSDRFDNLSPSLTLAWNRRHAHCCT